MKKKDRKDRIYERKIIYEVKIKFIGQCQLLRLHKFHTLIFDSMQNVSDDAQVYKLIALLG